MRGKKRKRGGRGKRTGRGNVAGGEGPSHPTETSADEVEDNEPYINLVWDMENCHIPAGYPIKDAFQNIRNVLGDNVNFHIIGDPEILNNSVRAEILAVEPGTNIVLAPSGIPDHGDKEMILTIYTLAATNTCNHFIFFTGDMDFCTTLSALRQRNITVGVACLPTQVSPILKWAATYTLNWSKLVTGIKEHLVEPRILLEMANDDGNNMNPIHIFWDLDTCSIPDQFRSSQRWLSELTESFQIFLRNMAYWGPFKIWSYGNSASLSDMIQEALQANFMSFQPVPHGNDRWWNVDAPKMIQMDASVQMFQCHCKSIFMFISDGDLESIKRSVKSKDHDLIFVRSSVDSSGDQTLKWPWCLIGE